MSCGRNLPGTVLQRFPMKLAMALSCLSCVCSVGGVFAGADPATGAPEVEARGFMDVTGAIGLHYDVDSGEGDSPILDGMGFENGGLAFGDIDNDGTFELYVAHGQDGEGRLFAFDGRHFVHLANNRGIRPGRMDRAGYFIDLDQDGWQDFVSVQSRQAQLFRNDGAGNFREATQRFGLRINRDAHARQHRQDRLCTVEGLDLALLVDAEHQRALRRRQIEAYDVADLVHEVRIARQLEGLRAVRLQAEGAPDAPDRRVRKAAFLGHRAQRPMGGVRRRRGERPLDNLGHLIVRERSRPSRPRLIRQPLDALLQEAAGRVKALERPAGAGEMNSARRVSIGSSGRAEALLHPRLGRRCSLSPTVRRCASFRSP